MRKSLKKYLKIAAIAFFVVFTAGLVTTVATKPVMADDPECELAVLPDEWCDGSNDIMDVVKFVLNTLATGVTMVGIVGIVICGVTYLTARDNEAQVAKAKKRLIDTVIGVVIWVLFALGANSIITLLVPKAEDVPDAAMLQTQEIEVEEVA